MTRTYLDHHAATPLGVGVREAMDQARRLAWANPSSAHAEGRAARAMLEGGRRAVAAALGASPADVVLTAGGTEACNLGALGLAGEPRGLTVVTSTMEHPAIERAVADLAARGAEVQVLPLHEGRGLVALRALAEAPGRRLFVLAQAASHETGTCLDLRGIAALVPPRTRGLVDGCQALGKQPLEGWAPPGWAVAISGAKIGASAGAGALLVPRGLGLDPRMLGGAQERGRRAGTPDVATHAGFGAACAELSARLEAMAIIAALRERLERALVAAGGVVNGATGPRLPTVTNVSFRGWRSATLVAALDLEGVAASAGAACSSGIDAPSSVVRALHPDEPWRAESCVRFSLGPETTEAEIERAIEIVRAVLARRVA